MRKKEDLIKDALRELHKNESFERALARVIRKNNGTYRDYIETISEIREYALKRKLDLKEAAKKLSSKPSSSSP